MESKNLSGKTGRFFLSCNHGKGKETETMRILKRGPPDGKKQQSNDLKIISRKEIKIMRKLKVYLDTSVISHLEQEDVPEKMEQTRKVWEILLYHGILSIW